MIVTYEGGKKTRTFLETEDAIYGFFGKYRFLSNFHLCNITCLDGFTYPSSENAYMAYKTVDLDQRLPFTNCSPKEARFLGQKILLRSDWESVKFGIMEDILRIKFHLPGLKPLLQATYPKHLEETNDWGDKIWGTVNGEGENNLGKILMKIRDEL